MTLNQIEIDRDTLDRLQTQLADFPEAIFALDTIGDCEGDLIDAAIVLAIRSGQQPEIDNGEWLASLAKKYRSVICQMQFRERAIDGDFVTLFEHFIELKACPKLLILPVLLYVHESGVNRFCEPLDSARVDS
jgi:hypothetical protein